MTLYSFNFWRNSILLAMRITVASAVRRIANFTNAHSRSPGRLLYLTETWALSIIPAERTGIHPFRSYVSWLRFNCNPFYSTGSVLPKGIEYYVYGTFIFLSSFSRVLQTAVVSICIRLNSTFFILDFGFFIAISMLLWYQYYLIIVTISRNTKFVITNFI